MDSGVLLLNDLGALDWSNIPLFDTSAIFRSKDLASVPELGFLYCLEVGLFVAMLHLVLKYNRWDSFLCPSSGDGSSVGLLCRYDMMTKLPVIIYYILVTNLVPNPIINPTEILSPKLKFHLIYNIIGQIGIVQAILKTEIQFHQSNFGLCLRPDQINLNPT